MKDDCVDADSLNPTRIYNTTTDPVTYAVLKFTFDNGIMGDTIEVSSIYGNSATKTVQKTLNKGSADAEVKKKYDTISAILKGRFSSDVTGTFFAYINYEDYNVDSVVYFPNPAAGFSETGLGKYYWSNISGAESKGKIFAGCTDMETQKNELKSGTAEYGCYPFFKSIGNTTKKT